ncbi:tRNA (adenosine(37)-N6)-dimethylallyltransferase MiaA [bacterium AH-315-B15]|nr:tRNA (adenosine(37)-N6)-dimethylallyltransferase MiaA [bacterium AH-315-B15]
MKKDLLVILGPTACGKTELASLLAAKLDAEIISADSRQVYRHMDIGTGKDLDEYEVDGKTIAHHLIDIHDPGYKYSIGEFQQDFENVYLKISKQRVLPILCGGSGLYIETALEGNSFLGIPSDHDFRLEADSLSQQKLERMYAEIGQEVKDLIPSDTRRRMVRAIEIDRFLKSKPDFEPHSIVDKNYIIFGLDVERENRREKITKRLKYRLDNGMIEEVEFLLKTFLQPEDLEYYGLEYKWVGRYLSGEISKDELFEKLNIAIHQFSKRQMTWFRRMEKNGFEINWIDASQAQAEKVENILNHFR